MVRLVDRGFHLTLGQAGGKVDQGGDRVSDGDAIDLSAPGSFMVLPPVGTDTGLCFGRLVGTTT
jgi:hypothetical protein